METSGGNRGKEATTPSIDNIEKRLRVLQRQLDRQHRSGSPECFDEKGRHIEGVCYWEDHSKRAQKTQAQIAKVHRKLAARRDSEQAGQKSSNNRRPPGKRSLARIRKRRMTKANGNSDSTARPEDEVYT